MAPQTTLLIVALALTLSVQGALCKNCYCKFLNVDSCAYAVESSGKRCVLEKPMLSKKLTCATSEIVADKLNDWIETEECVRACGVDRKALGISSDSLLDRNFVENLCSSACYDNCPNMVDLYFNLAAGEGVFLPKLCESRESYGRRGIIEVNEAEACAPTLAPSSSLKETNFGASKDAIIFSHSHL